MRCSLALFEDTAFRFPCNNQIKSKLILFLYYYEEVTNRNSNHAP